jgi:hypothetical protein
LDATVAYFSATGKNEQVARAIERELSSRGVTTATVFLKPRKEMGAVGGAIRSLLNRPVELAEPVAPVRTELLVLVGPVYASSISPPIAAYLRGLSPLEGRRVINVVCGFNTHPDVAESIGRRLKALGCGRIVDRAIRLRDVDSPEKSAALAAELVERALA